jgi:RNA polymerase sigma factor for flagellar operon FliA
VAKQSVRAQPGTRRPGVPDIAADLSRTCSSCRAVAELVSPAPGLSLTSIVEEVSRELEDGRTASRRSLEQNITNALANAITGYLRQRDVVLGGKRPTQVDTKLRAFLATGSIERAVSHAFQHAESPGALTALISQETLDGIDAERLCWAIINRETWNHINLLWQQANKLAANYPDRTAEDLLGWGWQGLRVALRQFDPDRGFAFSTYACTRIVGYIRDGIRAESPVPKRLATFARKVSHAEDSLTQEFGHAPDIEEVAARLGSDPAALTILTRLAPAASIDELSETRRGGSVLVEQRDPADDALSRTARTAIDDALDRLPEEEADAVRLLVLDGMDSREARQITGATARQLRQRRDRGLLLLRHELADWADAFC